MLTRIRLYRRLMKAEKAFDEALSDARRRGIKGVQLESIHIDASNDLASAWDDIGVWESRNLIHLASRLHVPIPPRSQEQMWEQSHEDGRWYLSDKGIFQVRTLVRQEEKALREAYLAWVLPLTGLIGAITGLGAIILYYVR